MADVTINQLPDLSPTNSTVVPISNGTVTGKTLSNNLGVPSGFIGLWSGTVVPSGWRLCDGTNGTPDLRNRFIVGSGSTYPLNTTGGSASSSVTSSGNIDNVAVSVAGSGGHNHIISYGSRGGTPNYSSSNQTAAVSTSRLNSSTVSSTGTASTISPYYSLAYIQKI